MLITLDTPYVDARAGDLSFALGLDPQPALHVLDVPDIAGPGTRLQLRLLGASHQVLLSTPGGRISETVACLPGRDAALPGRDAALMGRDTALPGRVQRSLTGHGYRFAAELTAAPGAARDPAWDSDAHTLIGVFPGGPDAFTMLRAEPPGRPDLVRWTTWHSYPQTGELVRTSTTVRIGGGPG